MPIYSNARRSRAPWKKKSCNVRLLYAHHDANTTKALMLITSFALIIPSAHFPLLISYPRHLWSNLFALVSPFAAVTVAAAAIILNHGFVYHWPVPLNLVYYNHFIPTNSSTKACFFNFFFSTYFISRLNHKTFIRFKMV